MAHLLLLRCENPTCLKAPTCELRDRLRERRGLYCDDHASVALAALMVEEERELRPDRILPPR